MTGFENYQDERKALEHEIARRLVMLRVDLDDEAAIRKLAHEALQYHGEHSAGFGEETIKHDLFGLAALMLKTMAESAETGTELHGGPVWKVFGKALWDAAGIGDS